MKLNSLISLFLPVSNSEIAIADLDKTPKANSNGRRMITKKMLKKSCDVAVATAFLYSFLFPIWAKATIELVTDVPMLAPRIKGTAPSTVKVPAATSVTMMEVELELLWITAVANMPMKRPTKGLCALLSISFAYSAPMLLKLVPNSLSETKKTNRVIMKNKIFTAA